MGTTTRQTRRRCSSLRRARRGCRRGRPPRPTRDGGHEPGGITRGGSSREGGRWRWCRSQRRLSRVFAEALRGRLFCQLLSSLRHRRDPAPPPKAPQLGQRGVAFRSARRPKWRGQAGRRPTSPRRGQGRNRGLGLRRSLWHHRAVRGGNIRSARKDRAGHVRASVRGRIPAAAAEAVPSRRWDARPSCLSSPPPIPPGTCTSPATAALAIS